ncbi:MAG: T9SS type A sorting domain-containing protein, partial [Bacteroidota bacterium]
NYWKFRTVGVAGTQNLTNSGEFSLYPNPMDGANGWIHLDHSYGDGQSTLVEWIDATGRIIHRQTLEGSGAHVVALSKGTIPAGLYQVRLNNKAFGNRTSRWIVR